MIYTRFGSEVEIIKSDSDSGDVTVKRKDGSQLECAISELKADDGFNEIYEAVVAVSGVKD